MRRLLLTLSSLSLVATACEIVPRSVDERDSTGSGGKATSGSGGGGGPGGSSAGKVSPEPTAGDDAGAGGSTTRCWPDYTGDSRSCVASQECNGIDVELRCLVTNNGHPPCTCRVAGELKWQIATGFDHSKAACLDDELFRFCAQQSAPPSLGVGGAAPSRGDAGASGADELGAGGAAPDVDAACANYCGAYSQICPQAHFGDPISCAVECSDDLELENATCRQGRRQAYQCIADALRQAPSDCSQALVSATERCGSAAPNVPECHDTCLPSLVEDSLGCDRRVRCAGVEVDLYCHESNGVVTGCTCSIAGKTVWEAEGSFDSSKSVCLDDDLFRLCARELP